MTRYNYGRTFKKNGKLVRYRYTNGRKSSKKLVTVKRKSNAKKKTYRRRY